MAADSTSEAGNAEVRGEPLDDAPLQELNVQGAMGVALMATLDPAS